MAQRAVQFDGVNRKNTVPPDSPRDGDEYFDSNYGLTLRYVSANSRFEAIGETTKPYNIHVGFTGGLDTNDGLTPGTRLKTFNRAFSLIPSIINHNIVVSLSSELFVEQMRIHNYKVGTGVTLSVQGGYSEVSFSPTTRTFSDDFSVTFTQVGAGFTPGSLVGKILRNGGGNIDRPIVANTADSLTILRGSFYDFDSMFAVPGVYGIESPSTIIRNGNGFNASVDVRSVNSLNFQHIQLGATTAEALNGAYAGIRLVDVFGLEFNGCFFDGGHPIICERVDDGSGITLKGCAINSPVFPASFIRSSVKLHGCLFSGASDTNKFNYVEVHDGSIVDMSSCFMLGASTMNHGVHVDTASAVRFTGKIRDTGGTAISVESADCQILNVVEDEVTVENCGSTYEEAGIYAINGSNILVNRADETPNNHFVDTLGGFITAVVVDGDTITISNDTAPVSRNGTYTINVLGVKSQTKLMVIHEPPFTDSFPGMDQQTAVCDYIIQTGINPPKVAVVGATVTTRPSRMVVKNNGNIGSQKGDGIAIQTGSSLSAYGLSSNGMPNAGFGLTVVNGSSYSLNGSSDISGQIKNRYVPGEDTFVLPVPSVSPMGGIYTVAVPNFCVDGFIKLVRVTASAPFSTASGILEVFTNSSMTNKLLTLNIPNNLTGSSGVFSDTTLRIFGNSNFPRTRDIYLRLTNTSSVAHTYTLQLAIERTL